ncbi:unnamed protein product [Vicia faba]|uniref:Uncharacterized protein n=1 Tax=Vicia faba TaxID=3906 RepID=A0AAV1AWR4_VICFA|nr:unnamed protein product [Vicia faba]
MNWTTMRIYLRNNPTVKVLGKLLLGQLVSSAVALMSITTSLIAEFGVDTPLTQSLFTYGSKYFNQSINLIPKLKFSGGSKIILGDELVIVGTVFYAISNVGEICEFCIKKKDRVEVVAMLGVYGFLVTAVEVSILELKTLESIKWSADIVLAFASYGVSSFIFYSFAPFVLKLSGILCHAVEWINNVSFAVVGIGLTIYSSTEKKSVPAAATTIEEDENLKIEYQILNGESEGVTAST